MNGSIKEGLTAALIVRDERENLEQLLPILAGAVDDIVIVDTGSTDGTIDVARAGGARVIEDGWHDDFSRARNRGLEEVRTSHVLWLDADDRLARENLPRIREAALARPNTALLLLLINEDPDQHAVTSCFQLRVFPNDPRHRFTGRVHEQILPQLTATGVTTARLDVPIRHRGYLDPAEVTRKARRNLQLLRREIEEDDRNLTALYHFVKAASRTGELEEGARIARQTVANPPPGSPADVIQALRVLGAQLTLRLGREEEAQQILREAVDADRTDPLARLFLGQRLRSKGDFAGAFRLLEAARRLPIRSGSLPVPVAGIRRAIRLQLGELCELFGRPADAVSLYKEILEADREDDSAKRACSRALLGAQRLEEAAAMLDALPDPAGGDAELALLRATLAFLQGQVEQARSHFEAAAALDPRAWAAPLHLGHLALRRGDLPSALIHYTKALVCADIPETRVGMAACQLEHGLAQIALEHLAKAADQARGRPLPAGTEALAGEALLLVGLPQPARDALEAHLKRFGPEPRIVSRLADCYREMGEPAAARVGYEEALRLEPTLATAREGLRALT
ncbi:MAG TPA: tetratricopeptide repeat protein [bacterium]|nr:tetratricopeptide repeat protein [bacterium]